MTPATRLPAVPERETRGRTYELTRHFLRHIFDNEWSAGTGQWQAAATSLVALLAPAAMLLIREASPDPALMGKYRRLLAAAGPERFRAAVTADEIAMLILLSVITGLIALFLWQSIYPSTRDCLALAGLPVRPRQIFAARLAAVVIFAGTLITGMNILPALVAPMEFAGRWAHNPSYGANLVAQAAAGMGACTFVFFAIVAVQGVLINLTSSRVSVWFQSAMAGALLLVGLRLWSIREWPLDTVHRLPEFGAWWPPVWFAGVREYVLGSRDPFWIAMAARGVAAITIAIASALVLYLVSYRRHRKLLLEGPSGPAATRTLRWTPLDLLGRDPRQRAILHFMAATLARSRTHRVIWLAYIGGAAALLINSSIVDGAILFSRGRRASLEFLVLFWPLTCTAVLLPGLRHAISIPAELRANWIFRLHEAGGRVQWMRAVERFVVAYAVAPIYLLLAPLSIYLNGWWEAARMTSLQILVSLTMFEVLFQSWQQLPFTCGYRPGKRPLVAIVAGYLATIGAIVPILSIFIAAAGKSAIFFAMLAPCLAALWLKMHVTRREGWGDAPLLYEDTSDLVGLSGVRGTVRPVHLAEGPT